MNLLPRITTAGLLITFCVILLFFVDDNIFSLVSLFVTVLMGYEWATLSGLAQWLHKAIYSMVLAVVLLFLHFNTEEAAVLLYYLVPVLFIFWCIVAGSIIKCNSRYYAILGNIPFTLALGYVHLCGFWMVLVYFKQQYIWMLCAVLISSITFDSFAYFIGNWQGKHKLCPQISPGKTWEGVFGGTFFSCLFSAGLLWVYVSYQIIMSTEFIFYFLITLVATFFSLFGDVFESLIKRIHGHKDSGSLLPGHGGLLDRCDSYFAALPTSLFLLIYLDYH